jgi:hypothetical protein
MVLMVTFLLVAGLGVWFAIARWDVANHGAAVVSALGAVAAVGVAIWAALGGTGNGDVSVSRTGKATARRNGVASSGVRVRSRRPWGRLRADRTGHATATDGGDANTGIRSD